MEKGQLERISKASGLRPQRPEPSLGVRSQSLPGCKLQAKRMAAGPGVRLSSLDQWGLGPGPRQPPSWFKSVPCHMGTSGL